MAFISVFTFPVPSSKKKFDFVEQGLLYGAAF